MNRKILYERTATGSYMKIEAAAEEGLDEKLMLLRKLPGTLPVEKAYVDGKGQYWYNISGKQSLDTCCSVKEIGIDLIEKLAVSLCSELDILERNMVQADCLMLEPEFIFITNANQEFIFTLYPGNEVQVELGFQRLMEYLLTKINHRDEAAVHTAYGIYDITLKEGYSIMDIRAAIIKERQQETKPETVPVMPAAVKDAGADEIRQEQKKPPEDQKPAEKCKKERRESIWEKLLAYVKRIPGYPPARSAKKPAKDHKEFRSKNKPDRRKVVQRPVPDENLVYPDEEMNIPAEEIHPTVCLSGGPGSLQGVLLYQGSESIPDIRIERDTVRIGYGKEADVRIADDTVSQMHARIDREGCLYYIEDLNSTNGTYVNDELLAFKERRLLQVNDVVRFANLRYRFC